MGQGRAGNGGANEVESGTDRDLAPPISTLDESEIAVLRDVGEQWGRALTGRGEWLAALPVDPEVHRFPRKMKAGRAGRVAPVEFVRTGASERIAATPHAAIGPSISGHVLSRLRRTVLGAPLATTALAREQMRKIVALPILSSDALSSVAYGPEAMVGVLALAGSAALGMSLWVGAVIVVLMLAVGLSYRQVIRAYPRGGGSYAVAGENLGETASLVAAAGLMTDYVLTVAVSISSGVAAITSAAPGLADLAAPISVAVVLVLLAGNLRGAREAGALFAAPTYLFIVAMFALIAAGIWNASDGTFEAPRATSVEPLEALTVFLVLRAFSAGATAMTGIEAISNAVPTFKPTSWRNARTVLTVMIGLLVAMFAGLVVLMYVHRIGPDPDQTMLSTLAHASFGSGPIYIFVQAATALILLMAANTAFNGFPRLLSVMARRGHAPRLFLRVGDRLAFSNGIILLAIASSALLIAFDAKTDRLIPLYAVGVFVAFTISQSGMVVHWWRTRDAGWRRAIVINTVGAVLSAIVFLVSGTVKFVEGAWVALALTALLGTLGWRTRCHYDRVRAALALRPPRAKAAAGRGAARPALMPIQPAGAVRGADGLRGPAQAEERPDREPEEEEEEAEEEESPDEVRHLVVVPVARFDLSSLRALAYASSLGQPVLAVHLSPSDDEAAYFRELWDDWGDHLPLQVVDTPYRAVVAPLTRYIRALRAQRPDVTLTVVLSELVPRHWWHKPLHNGINRRLGRALRGQSGVVTTVVPLHLPT